MICAVARAIRARVWPTRPAAAAAAASASSSSSSTPAAPGGAPSRPLHPQSSDSQHVHDWLSEARQDAATPVVIYSKSTCPYCYMAKEVFRDHGQAALAYELNEMPGGLGATVQDTLRALTGQSTVPHVFVGGEFVGGYTETARAAQTGELDKLLALAHERSGSLNNKS